ncbi:MAG: FlgO family outer membrane protein [Elusimicrobiota bacterium]
MKAKKMMWLAALALLAAQTPALWAAGAAAYRLIAAEVARMARDSSTKKVAVLPFRVLHSEDRRGGEAVSERLVSRLAQEPGIQVVERGQLDKVLKEQEMEQTGAVEAVHAKRIGRIMGVDAVVTGTILRSAKGKAEVNARLIDAEDARVIGAVVAEVERDWNEPQDSITVPAPILDVSFTPWWEAGSASAAGFEEDGCEGFEERIDALQRAVLEAKARYWSDKLRTPGFSARSLSSNPGSDIRSLQSRSLFYGRVRELYDSGARQPLSAEEMRAVERSDARVKAIRERCEK